MENRKGNTRRQVAEMFGVHPVRISQIVHGREVKRNGKVEWKEKSNFIEGIHYTYKIAMKKHPELVFTSEGISLLESIFTKRIKL